MISMSGSSCARGEAPRAPAAPPAAGEKRAADDESSAAEADTGTDRVCFESPRIDIYVRSNPVVNGSDPTSAPCLNGDQ